MTTTLLLLFALSRSSRNVAIISRRCISTTAVRMTSASTSQHKHLVVDPFCFRQFAETEASKAYGGTVFSTSIATFEDIVNSRYNETMLRDGYAPFCKHLFIENDFTNACVNVLPITPSNEPLLRTKYEARNDKELPVLTRFFPKDLVAKNDDDLPVAKYLDLIMYSREQINKENIAQGRPANLETAEWGIVSVKAQDIDKELPMNPITAMRNALGKEEGGSGIPIDRAQYMQAVDYWNCHAVVS
ncbi:hypothetical protein MPSEU_000529500 [Mayamaea pseudoterrestris]|nr:hypothetical protein MPSEU_000529500 [Mayamaea pseudoterrestris]